MRKKTRSLEINTTQIQAVNSKVCGMFCCVILLQLSRDYSLKQILKNFSPMNFHLNQMVVKKMIENNGVNK